MTSWAIIKIDGTLSKKLALKPTHNHQMPSNSYISVKDELSFPCKDGVWTYHDARAEVITYNQRDYTAIMTVWGPDINDVIHLRDLVFKDLRVRVVEISDGTSLKGIGLLDRLSWVTRWLRK